MADIWNELTFIVPRNVIFDTMTPAGNTSIKEGFLRSEQEKHYLTEGHFNLHLRKKKSLILILIYIILVKH